MPASLDLTTYVELIETAGANLRQHAESAGFDTALDADVALDGIDELLSGFVPRDRSSLRSDEAYTLSIAPTDTRRGWLLHIADGPVVTRADRVEDADAAFEGAPAQLLLGLWNRGDEIVATGRAGVLDAWRSGHRVTWGT